MGLFETIAGGVTGGLFDIAGGLLDAGQERQQQRHQDDVQRVAWQRDDTAIERRVQDAKRAGLHPLYAMGASVPASSTPQYVGGGTMGRAMSEAGQNIGSSISRAMNQTQRMKDQLELKLLAKQADESDARKELYLSEAARNRAAGQISVNPFGTGVQLEKGSTVEGQNPNPPGVGVIELQGAPVVSAKQGRPDLSAGVNPGYQEIMIGPGMPMEVPIAQGESWQEIVNEMSFPSYLGMLMRNSEKYGEGWLDNYIQLYYFGQPPNKKFSQTLERQKFVPKYAEPEGTLEYWSRMADKARRRWFK